jgi:hypothetical protein
LTPHTMEGGDWGTEMNDMPHRKLYTCNDDHQLLYMTKQVGRGTHGVYCAINEQEGIVGMRQERMVGVK